VLITKNVATEALVAQACQMDLEGIVGKDLSAE